MGVPGLSDTLVSTFGFQQPKVLVSGSSHVLVMTPFMFTVKHWFRCRLPVVYVRGSDVKYADPGKMDI